MLCEVPGVQRVSDYAGSFHLKTVSAVLFYASQGGVPNLWREITFEIMLKHSFVAFKRETDSSRPPLLLADHLARTRKIYGITAARVSASMS